MEEVCRFPLLQLKPSDAPPPLRHPRKRGDDGKRDCVETRMQKITQNEQPDFVAVSPILLQEARKNTVFLLFSRMQIENCIIEEGLVYFRTCGMKKQSERDR